MAINTFRSGLISKALALIAGLLVAGSVAAQTPEPAKAAPAKKTAPAKKVAVPEFKMVLEARAIDLLKAMSVKLAAAKSMSFTAVVGYEYPSKLGPPIVYTSRYDVTMQRPDKLRVIMPGDGPASEFYYDGKTMMAYAPVENLVAVADAPPTIEAALKAAFDTAAIYYPFGDLLVTDPYAVLANGAILAFYIGPSGVVGGAKTDMVAWANKDVFVQIWIGADDKLPRRMRATFAADPMQLRHEMELTNWQLDGSIAADAFASAKAQGAGRIAFKSPTALPPGVKPLVGSKPTASTTTKGSSKSQ
ncbi:MAG TPA: DUF2092 domain-containing protein [Burkholderiaceae bacterium]|nr:DUF2092 domain-containing protein [Burkholderiaceae bacterium]